ncbi:uncharacterized protein NPIL_566421 [Nephila pilipes]|uniref:Uncharacterized protein n=1 Tax=Nephila pilipes TaxID=299642 RepID=A0A8X6MEA3_NEPPI|nr:uncharacterized protein NPIL_566421 [Nephila pilipes]
MVLHTVLQRISLLNHMTIGSVCGRAEGSTHYHNYHWSYTTIIPSAMIWSTIFLHLSPCVQLMLPQDILGAATGVGLALFIALSAIICKYYSRTRKERMILYSPPRRPSQDRRQKRLMHMREASAMAALPPQQQENERLLQFTTGGRYSEKIEPPFPPGETEVFLFWKNGDGAACDSPRSLAVCSCE